MELKRKLCRALAYPFLWPIIHMPGHSFAGQMLALTEEEQATRHELERSVGKLADEIGERNKRNYQGLLAAEEHIKTELSALGYTVSTQSFQYEGVEMHNVEAEMRGSSRPHEIVVVGAHYDTVYGSPGADDNASGTAALLAIARLLRAQGCPRTIRFVAFANEENPNGIWEGMGSYAYARMCKERGDHIVGMVSLEMLGVYSDAPGSQNYPAPFNLLYPSVGNFVAFVGNFRSGRFVRQCVGSFRQNCQFPSEGVAAPEMFRDIHRSDHWSFWQFGYPALMITDTSNFRNRVYHTENDTPAIIDFSRMARLTHGLARMIVELSSR